MNKRGQIAVFVIIGIVVLVLVGLVLAAKSSIDKKVSERETAKAGEIAFEVGPIKAYAQGCLKMAGENGIWILGLHGGYLNTSVDNRYKEEGTAANMVYLGTDIPYYLGAGGSVLELSQIEQKLARYVIVKFDECMALNNFDEDGFSLERPIIDYAGIGFNFSAINVKSNVSINQDNVVVNVAYPMKAKKKEFEARLSEFRVDLPIRVGMIYSLIADNILTNISNSWANGQLFDASAINCNEYDISNKTNIYSISMGNDGIVRIIDYYPYYHKYTKSFIFQFAVNNNPQAVSEGKCTDH
ncbi:MAG TPA: hypothetical protein VFF28_04740 [Candidatus Nanoarchaeia archaeon]|nr:hypothetical protein [Candidatus Nanoarchaeia archaeon]